jgi:tetratricopeptide (TPR) repeat protein
MASPNNNHRVWLLCLGLILGVLFAFGPVIDGGFINYDDDLYVTSNAQVQNGLTLEGIGWAFRSTEASNWHPLTWISHMVDCQLFGLKAWGHHFSSLLLHTVNTLLVFVVLRRMTGATWRSAFVAALFGLHPLRVESVAWVAERKDVLSATFSLLTVWAYVRFAEESKVRSPQSRIYYGLALVCFCLGLLSKPMVVTIPFVLLLLDYWPLGRSSRFGAAGHQRDPVSWTRLAWEKLPFFLLAAGSSAITFMVQKRGGAMETLAGLPWNARVENAVVSYCRYLGKLVYPVNLSVFYPHAGHSSVGTWVLSASLLLGVTALVVVTRRRWPHLLVGWFWFVGTLVPVIGLVQVGEQSMADRYTYVPTIGVIMLVTWGVHELVRKWRYRAITLRVIAGGVTLLCMALTRQQAAFWRNSGTLFRHAIAVTESNHIGYLHLGDYLSQQGQIDDAIAMYRQAIQIFPSSIQAHNNLGNALLAKGRLDDAIGEFQETLKLRPDHSRAHSNLGVAWYRKGRLDQAINEFQEAIKLRPGYADAHSNLGNALLRKHLLDEGISELQAGVKLNPSDADAHYNLGTALESKGRSEEALDQFKETVRLQPHDADAHNSFGSALGRMGRLDEAISQFEEAIKLKPDIAEAHYNLGAVLAGKGRRGEAITHFTRALQLQPNYPEAEQQLHALQAKLHGPEAGGLVP